MKRSPPCPFLCSDLKLGRLRLRGGVGRGSTTGPHPAEITDGCGKGRLDSTGLELTHSCCLIVCLTTVGRLYFLIVLPLLHRNLSEDTSVLVV